MDTRSAGFLVRVVSDADFSGGDFLTNFLEESLSEFFRRESSLSGAERRSAVMRTFAACCTKGQDADSSAVSVFG
jgi:hypothetical protein